MTPSTTDLRVKRLAQAQGRLERWEKRLARAATEVLKHRAEVRRRWAVLEGQGIHVDPMLVEEDTP